MTGDKIQVASDVVAGNVFIGPSDDFNAVERAGNLFWCAGTFYNRSPDHLADAVLGDRDALSRFPAPHAIVRRSGDGAVSVTTDRYGRVPIYVSRSGDDIWISTSLRWLAASLEKAARLDEQSIGELLTFKFVLGDKSVVDGISRVPPATIQSLDEKSNWIRERYWFPAPTADRRSLESELQTLTDLFANGVKRIVDGVEDVAITLSGGLDSRAILAAALDSDASVRTVTTGIAGGMDHRYAEMAAKTAGVPLNLALLGAEYRAKFFDYTRRSLEIYEGMLLTPGTETLWMIESSADVPIQLVLHGALGELAKGATANHFEIGVSEIEACNSDVGQLLASRYEKGHRRMLAVLKPSVRANLEGEALQNVKDTANALTSEMAPLDVPFAMQILEHFRNSGTYSAKVWNQSYPTMFPFADPDYVDHLLSVCAEDRIGSRFHYELLKRLHDGLYRCPESNSGVAPSAPELLRKLSVFKVRVMNKLGMKSAAGHTDFCAWINEMQPGIEDVLLKDSVLCDLYWDGDQVRKYVDRSRHGDESAAQDLYRLFCLELIYGLLSGNKA